MQTVKINLEELLNVHLLPKRSLASSVLRDMLNFKNTVRIPLKGGFHSRSYVAFGNWDLLHILGSWFNSNYWNYYHDRYIKIKREIKVPLNNYLVL